MNLWEPRPRQPLAPLALCAMLGICAADRWNIAPPWSLAAFALVCAVTLLRPSTAACWLACALAFFNLHTLLYRGSEGQELAKLVAAGPRVVRATGIVSTEPEKPKFFSRNVTARFRLRAESLEIAGETRSSNVLLNVAWAGPPASVAGGPAPMPEYGDRVSILGSVKAFENPRNPGQFDFANYSRRQGVFCEIRSMYPSDCRIEGHGQGNPVRAFAYRSRHWIQRTLALDLEDSPEMVNVIESIILGLQSDSPEDLKALLQRTGTVHLVAVSGLNVVLLAGIIIALLRPFRVGRILSAAVLVVILVTYGLVTGFGAGCMRATVMTSIFYIATAFDRRSISFNSLAAAALIMLVWNTNELFSTGFQFSFAVVAVIIACASRIARFVEPIGLPDPFLPRDLWNWRQRTGAFAWRKCAGALGLTISAWLGSLLFTAGYFNLFSPSSLVANFCAVWFAFFMLALGVAALLLAPVWKTGAILCNNANWAVAKGLLWTLKMFAALPGGYLYVETPSFTRAPTAEFTVLDLGDGGAIHLRTGGRDWLLDCGNSSGYERIVLPYLRSRGVNHLDGMLLAHGSVKHLGAAAAVVDDFHPGSIAESVLKDRSTTRTRFNQELVHRGLGKALYDRGDFVRLNDALALRVLYPPAGLKRGPADDKALVLQFDCDGVRALFMSDSGFSTEQWLIENEPDLRSDVVIKGQHSRDFSGTLDFLSRVQPQVIICGAAPYGKSSEDLDAWERETMEQGITVFRQDHSGAVRLQIRGGRFEARAFVGGQTFLSRAR